MVSFLLTPSHMMVGYLGALDEIEFGVSDLGM